MMKRHRLFAPIIPLLLLATSFITVHASELDRNNTNKTEPLYFSKTREKVTEDKEELYQKLLQKCKLLEQEKRKLQDELQKEKNNNSNNTNKKSGTSSIYIHRSLSYTPLHRAAQQGKIKALEELWKNSYYRQYLNNQHNQDQLTPLLCALKKKQWKAAEWLINKGAWIDVADSKGYNPLQKIITLNGWKKDKAAMALILYLLQKHTFFPTSRIEAAVNYVVDQGLDQKTQKRKPLTQKIYHIHLCKAVTRLLGEDVKDFQYVLLNRDFYKAASINRENEKRENIDKNIDYTTGLSTRGFLPCRVALLFDVLVRLQQGDLSSNLPETHQEEVYEIKDIYKAGLKELQTQFTTFWANKLIDVIYCLRFDLNPQQLESCYHAWAQGIVHCLPRLRFPQEISLALGYGYYNNRICEARCIYVSLTQTSDYYIVRVDNRWINTAPKESHPLKKQILHQKEMTCLQPYAVAYFPIRSWDKHKAWLLNYIARAGQISQGYKPSEVIPHLYQTKQKPPKEGNKPTWAKQWPWRPLQTTAGNSFMRSHNVGYRIRLGNNLYEWFRQKSLGSYLLEQKFLKKQPSSYKESSNDEEETKEE